MLLVQPGAGDELQGIKRGVVERADIVVVTKADGVLAGPAAHAKSDFEAALSLYTGEGPWTPCVIACSSVEGHGLDEIAAAVERHRAALAQAGALEARRAAQARAWLWREIEDSLTAALRADARRAPAVAALEADVAAQTLSPSAAARRIVGHLLNCNE